VFPLNRHAFPLNRHAFPLNGHAIPLNGQYRTCSRARLSARFGTDTDFYVLIVPFSGGLKLGSLVLAAEGARTAAASVSKGTIAQNP
jgi:hypothetical protein